MFWPFPCSDQEPWPGPPFSYDFYTCANGRDQAAPSIAQKQTTWREKNQMMIASVTSFHWSTKFSSSKPSWFSCTHCRPVFTFCVKFLRVCAYFHAHTSWLRPSHRGIRDDRISMVWTFEGRRGKVKNFKPIRVELVEPVEKEAAQMLWNAQKLHLCGNQSIWTIHHLVLRRLYTSGSVSSPCVWQM